MSARILIAEDDEMQGAALRTVLACRGYAAENVTDGLEAVRRLRGGQYQLALLDFRMPEISGLATAKLLHDLLPPANCPRLIAVTAAADELQEIERHADTSSFDAIVSKQSGLQALLDAIEANAYRSRSLALTDPPSLADVPSPDLQGETALPGMSVIRYDDIETDDAGPPAENILRYPFRNARERPHEIQTISLAAFKLTMGPAWARISHRAMLRAERIIRRRLNPKDVVSRISDHGFAIWFSNASETHMDAVLGGAVREIRVRFMMDYGEDVPPNPDLLI